MQCDFQWQSDPMHYVHRCKQTAVRHGQYHQCHCGALRAVATPPLVKIPDEITAWPESDVLDAAVEAERRKLDPMHPRPRGAQEIFDAQRIRDVGQRVRDVVLNQEPTLVTITRHSTADDVRAQFALADLRYGIALGIYGEIVAAIMQGEA